MDAYMKRLQTLADEIAVSGDTNGAKALAASAKAAHDQLKSAAEQLRANLSRREQAVRLQEQDISEQQAALDASRASDATLQGIKTDLESVLESWKKSIGEPEAPLSQKMDSLNTRVKQLSDDLGTATLPDRIKKLQGAAATAAVNEAASQFGSLDSVKKCAEALSAATASRETDLRGAATASGEATAKGMVETLQQGLQDQTVAAVTDAETRLRSAAEDIAVNAVQKSHAALKDEAAETLKSSSEALNKASKLIEADREAVDTELKELRQFKEQTLAKEPTLDARDREIAELQRELKEENAALSRLREEKGALEDAAVATTTKLGSLNLDVAGLQKKAEGRKADRDAARKELEQLKEDKAADVAASSATLKARDDEVAELKRQVGEATTELSELRQYKQQAMTSATTTAATLEARDDEVAELKRQVGEATTELSELRQYKQQAMTSATTTAATLEARDDEVAELKRQVGEATTELSELRQYKQQAMTSATTTAATLEARDDEVAELKRQVGEATTELSELRQYKQQAMTSAATSTTTLEARDNQVAELKRQLEEAADGATAQLTSLRESKERAERGKVAAQNYARQVVDGAKNERKALADALKRELDDVRSHAKTSREIMKRAMDEVTEHRESTEATHAREIKSLKEQLAKRATDLLHTERRENAALKGGQQLESSLKAAKAVAEELRRKCSAAEKAAAEARSRADKAETRAEELFKASEKGQQDLNSARQTIQDLQTAALASSEAFGRKSQSAVHWEGRASLLEVQLQVASKAKQEADGRCRELRAQVEEAKQQRDQAEEAARDTGVASVQSMLRTNLDRFMASVSDIGRVQYLENSLRAAEAENAALESQVRAEAAAAIAQLDEQIEELQTENQGLLQQIEEATRPPSPPLTQADMQRKRLRQSSPGCDLHEQGGPEPLALAAAYHSAALACREVVLAASSEPGFDIAGVARDLAFAILTSGQRERLLDFYEHGMTGEWICLDEAVLYGSRAATIIHSEGGCPDDGFSCVWVRVRVTGEARELEIRHPQ
ncbi:hypothetical protein PLICBS_009996 [Purpureocillium lilacinum]|uniref:uncharacterized protein n=1 Tax=Purpureocillium lilacinum TaxID=33203 RepID=UPI0020815909|nr:hypothetical protein PLICBS_009996 [Purpureocillium lilacinum]